MRVSAHELAFSMRDRYGLESKMVGFYHMPADRLRNIMADKHDVDATAAKYTVISHLRPFTEKHPDSMAHPAFVGDRLYLRSRTQLICVRLADD